MLNDPYDFARRIDDTYCYSPQTEITGYERLESGEELQPHNAGDSYCKKFCNKPTDDAIHDYDEDEQEFGFHQTARKALRI